MKLNYLLKVKSFALIIFLAISLVVIIDRLTNKTINENEIKAQREKFLQLLSENSYDNKIENTKQTYYSPEIFGNNYPINLYVARKGKTIKAFLIEVETNKAYNDKIKILIAIDTNNKIITTRVIAHKETPGIGDKMLLSKSNWILQFDNENLANHKISKWKVKKDGGDFDSWTGATITPRAIIDTIAKSLIFMKQLRERDDKLQ